MNVTRPEQCGCIRTKDNGFVIIKIKTKRIGKFNLNKIITISYEQCPIHGGWWVNIDGEHWFMCSWGPTKKEAKEEFEKDFEYSAYSFQGLIKDYEKA